MTQPPSQANSIETPSRINPTRLEELPEEIADIVAELSAKAATLESKLHPSTAKNLANLVRVMNCYYSNLIEGHNTRPKEIENALQGEFDKNDERRNLQQEATAHISVQSEIDQMADGKLPEPASKAYIKGLHRKFYEKLPQKMLLIKGTQSKYVMDAGEWRNQPQHDVSVGRHIPPSRQSVDAFMGYFEQHYRFEKLGKAARIAIIPAAHHRLNYIHPFPDGNGRVSRLMSHAMAAKAGIGAHGLWSISRGLARGLESRTEYKSKMDWADSPRKGDLDGRGNLSQEALTEFILWFLKVCLDQIEFMTNLFEFEVLASRLERYTRQHEKLKLEAKYLLQEALLRGQFERGSASRITGLPARTAQRILNELVREGMLASLTPKGPVSLRFPTETHEIIFPRLFPST